MKRSYLFKAVGVLIILVLFFALPTVAFAEDTETVDDIGEFLDRIPGFGDGDTYIPDIPTDLEPGTFYINMFAYEQSVLADEKFALIVSYAYSGQSVSAAYNPTLKLTLSEEIKYIEFYDEDLSPISAEVSILDTGEQSVIFHLDGPIAAGTIGNIIAVAKLDGELLDSTDTPYADAEVSATGTGIAETGQVFVDPVTNPSDWMLLLYKDYPLTDPAPDGEVTYGVTLYGNSEENGLDLGNVAIEVSYPQYAEVLDAGGGTLDETNHTITWQHGSLLIEEMAERWFTLRYPAEYYTNGAVMIGGKLNSADLSAKASANVSGMQGVFNTTAKLSHAFAAPTVKLGAVAFGRIAGCGYLLRRRACDIYHLRDGEQRQRQLPKSDNHGGFAG